MGRDWDKHKTGANRNDFVPHKKDHLSRGAQVPVSSERAARSRLQSNWYTTAMQLHLSLAKTDAKAGKGRLIKCGDIFCGRQNWVVIDGWKKIVSSGSYKFLWCLLSIWFLQMFACSSARVEIGCWKGFSICGGKEFCPFAELKQCCGEQQTTAGPLMAAKLLNQKLISCWRFDICTLKVSQKVCWHLCADKTPCAVWPAA